MLGSISFTFSSHFTYSSTWIFPVPFFFYPFYICIFFFNDTLYTLCRLISFCIMLSYTLSIPIRCTRKSWNRCIFEVDVSWIWNQYKQIFILTIDKKKSCWGITLIRINWGVNEILMIEKYELHYKKRYKLIYFLWILKKKDLEVHY